MESGQENQESLPSHILMHQNISKTCSRSKEFCRKKNEWTLKRQRMESFSQYAVAAAKEAFEDAGLDMAEEDPYRIGTIIGSGIVAWSVMKKIIKNCRSVVQDA